MVKHRIPSEYDLDQIAERKRLEMQKKIEAAAVALDVITLTTQAKSLNLSHVDLSSKYSDEALEGKTSGQEDFIKFYAQNWLKNISSPAYLQTFFAEYGIEKTDFDISVNNDDRKSVSNFLEYIANLQEMGRNVVARGSHSDQYDPTGLTIMQGLLPTFKERYERGMYPPVEAVEAKVDPEFRARFEKDNPLHYPGVLLLTTMYENLINNYLEEFPLQQ